MANNLIINEDVLADIEHHAERFSEAKPFRHVVIDDFFTAPMADALLEQFPSFEIGNARNESGDLGNKSTVQRIRALGSAYVALDDAVKSRTFLDTIGVITGIDGLLYDPWYFGGGTHCNRSGQDLDAHVDFNRHPVRRWHRRLNLIVYLNHEWHDDWGGSLGLHTNPRSDSDQIKLVTPLFNRCVIFETTENSWHSFGPIQPAEDKRDSLRRSVALYFYSEDRPAEELADTHATIYVDRPLPKHIVAGHTMTATDLAVLRSILERRDQHTQRLYGEVGRLQARLERAQDALTRGTIGRVKYFIDRVRTRFGK